MGGTVSAGEDNDELIDNLVDADYIKSPDIEQIFRAVDRADYYVDDFKDNAYRDLAWKHGNLHLSAPCIYSEVMESLKLKSGHSFLNLGSGTGYLSTMAGLILGTNGINHGIELQLDVVDYAQKKLAEFKRTSAALDEYEFCEPYFVVGNCLLLDSSAAQYDRVYCGASCPPEHENYMKNLIKIGGILVMPLNDQLLQISRKSDTTWDVKTVLPVSFASLVLPTAKEGGTNVKLPDFLPLTLQEICRSAIRVQLRRNIDIENSELKGKKRCHPRHKRSKKKIKQIVIPIMEESDDSFPDNDAPSEDNSDNTENEQSSQPADRQTFELMNQISGMLHGVTQEVQRSGNNTGATEDNNEEHQLSEEEESSKDTPKQNNKKFANDNKIQNPPDAFHFANCDDLMDTSDEDYQPPRRASDRKRSVDDDDDYNRKTSHKATGLSDVRRRRRNGRSNTVIICKRLAYDVPVSSSPSPKVSTDRSSSSASADVIDEGITYRSLMKSKISKLPLPFTLKVFLNYDRSF